MVHLWRISKVFFFSLATEGNLNVTSHSAAVSFLQLHKHDTITVRFLIFSSFIDLRIISWVQLFYKAKQNVWIKLYVKEICIFFRPNITYFCLYFNSKISMTAQQYQNKHILLIKFFNYFFLLIYDILNQIHNLKNKSKMI